MILVDKSMTAASSSSNFCMDDILETKSLNKVALAFAGLLLSWVLSSYTITLADERTPNPSEYRPLPDIFIDNFARVPWASTVSELIIVVFLVMLCFMLVFHRYRALIAIRCCVILSTLYMFRAMTIWVTSLPMVGSHLNCLTIKPQTIKDRLGRAVKVLMSQGMDIYGSNMCGDYIFSGHACMLVTMAHFLTEYVNQSLILFRISVWLVCSCGVLSILAAHFHYTVDVVLAVVIASQLFIYYHALCQCPAMFDPDIRKRFVFYIPLFYLYETRESCALRSRMQGAFHIPEPIAKWICCCSKTTRINRRRDLRNNDEKETHSLIHQQQHRHQTPTTTTVHAQV